MAASDTEQLVVALEARVGNFERDMRNAENTATRSFQAMTSGAARAGQQFATSFAQAAGATAAAATVATGAMASMGGGLATVSTQAATANRVLTSVGLNILGRLVPPLAAVTTAFAAFRLASTLRANSFAELEKLVEIAERAQASGLGATAFQQFTAQATRMRVEVDDLNTALQTFRTNTRAGLDDYGGRTASPLQQRFEEMQDRGGNVGSIGLLGAAALEGARTQEERLRSILGLLADLERSGQRLVALDIAQRAFGDGAMLERLRSGATSFTTLAAEAERANASIASPDTVARAAELDDRLRRAHDTIANSMRPAFQDIIALGVPLVGIGVNFQEGLAGAATAAGNLYGELRNIASMNLSGITQDLNRLRGFVARIGGDASADWVQATPLGRVQGAHGRTAIDPYGFVSGASTALGESSMGSAWNEHVNRLRQGANADGSPSLASTWSGRPVVTIGGQYVPPIPPVRPDDLGNNRSTARNGSSSTSPLDAYTRNIATIQGRTRALEEERQLVGRATGEVEGMRVRIELETAARRHNLTLTEQQRAAITQEAEARRAATESLARARMQGDIRYERGLLGLSETDVKIAQRLRDLYGNDIPAALASSEAAGLRLNEALRQSRDLGSDFFGNLARDIASGTAPLQALSNGLTRIGTQLVEMAARNLWQEAFGGMTGGGGGGGLGFLSSLFGSGAGMPTFAPMYHSGGIVGAGTLGRYIHPAYFDDAPRYHTGMGGLMSNEVAAILQRGEQVLTRDRAEDVQGALQSMDERNARATGGGGAAPVVNFIVENRSSAVRVRQEQTPQGDIRAIIEDVMADHLGNPNSKPSRAAATTFGLNRSRGLR